MTQTIDDALACLAREICPFDGTQTHHERVSERLAKQVCSGADVHSFDLWWNDDALVWEPSETLVEEMIGEIGCCGAVRVSAATTTRARLRRSLARRKSKKGRLVQGLDTSGPSPQ